MPLRPLPRPAGVDSQTFGKKRAHALQIGMNPKYLPQISSQGGSALGLATVAFEKHYRVRELARLWGLSAKTVTRMFVEEAGVIRVANDGTGKRKYATLSIPESVALRVHERLGNQPLQATLAGGHPLRIIRLGDLHAGVSKKPRNVIKLKPSQELTHSECVP